MELPIPTQTQTQTPVETLSHSQTVPSQYIQPPTHRPTPTQLHSLPSNTTTTIPTLDLSLPKPTLLTQLSNLCRTWGAFHVSSHGVPTSLLHSIRTVGSSFFNDLDVDDKLKFRCDPSAPTSQGYGSKMLLSDDPNGVVLDWRDYFDHHTFPLERRDPLRWPDYPPNYRQVVEEYSEHMKKLAQKLLALISESLGLHSSRIEDIVGEFYQNITVSYYPPCPQPELTLGLQSHSDMGAITLLIQDDVGGLEVLKDGKWVNVQPLSDAILVIMADQTEVITNGEYRSSIHRAVTNASRARLSVATFHDPARTRKISPAEELVARSTQRYKEVLYGDFIKSWYTKGPEGKRNLDALLL